MDGDGDDLETSRGDTGEDGDQILGTVGDVPLQLPSAHTCTHLNVHFPGKPGLVCSSLDYKGCILFLQLAVFIYRQLSVCL